MTKQAQIITGTAFLDWLRGHGIFETGDHVRRVVIDAVVNEPLMVYVERYGDERLVQKPLPARLLQAIRDRIGMGRG